MAILTPNDVGPFLGIPVDAPGLPDAIEQAEALVAAQLKLRSLEFNTYDEARVMMYPTRQVLPKHGPVQAVNSFFVDEDDYLNEVVFTEWSIRFSNPHRAFRRLGYVEYNYDAGWTDDAGEYPLPTQVKAYVKSMVGLTYDNMLASGVVSGDLGDMRVEIDRAGLMDNLEPYKDAIRSHARPY